MKKCVTILAIFLYSFSNCQTIVQYYDYNWKIAKLSDARYYSVIVPADSVFHRQDFFVNEKSLQMDGYYKDTACKIAHGPFHYFYANGITQLKGNYYNNKKSGVWLSFHPNGMMSDSVFYDNGMVTGTRLGWHSNGYPSDSAVWNLDGTGVEVSWFDNGNPSSAGMYSNGKMIGKWRYFHKNGSVSSEEIFNNGVLLSKIYYDEKGIILNDTTTKDREATFIGGLPAWKKYLEKHLYFPPQWQFKNDGAITVIISAVIDEEGNVSDVNVRLPFQKDFDFIAVKVMKASPKWQPAMMHNRRVKYYLLQPITFAQITE